ncbi:MAG: hypothetical protein ACK4Y5_20705 [Acetobacteraceae bacterium]|jgi:hypothetical protein
MTRKDYDVLVDILVEFDRRISSDRDMPLSVADRTRAAILNITCQKVREANANFDSGKFLAAFDKRTGKKPN